MTSSSSLQLSSLPETETILQLPYPYFTEFTVRKTDSPLSTRDIRFYQIQERHGSSKHQLPTSLQNDGLFFSEPSALRSVELPSDSNNSAWARARRSPYSVVSWDSKNNDATPTLAQAWMLLYVLFTIQPEMEALRLELVGVNAAKLGAQLKDVLLAVDHPLPPRKKRAKPAAADTHEVVALRSTFWQGAGSPFGPRPVWCPSESPISFLGSAQPLSSYPLAPVEHTISFLSAGDPQDPERSQQAFHPIRPAKPAPGAVVYSRWIPHLRETFSMVSLDYANEEHLKLFHDWQNDPRVSQGWNETGTIDQHREYLRNVHEDPHQVAVLAKWNDTFFAYFEVYWAKASNNIDPVPGL